MPVDVIFKPNMVDYTPTSPMHILPLQYDADLPPPEDRFFVPFSLNLRGLLLQLKWWVLYDL